ncbi:MAG: Chromate transport protein [Planctomycetes bacterium ADurb.Bin412]|nr:MAG: Chromate transport protein [Planctomycetes bacterium ADurb.Bin412]
MKGPVTALAGLGILVLYFIGINEVALLFGGGLAVMIVLNVHRLRNRLMGVSLLPLGGIGLLSQAVQPVTLSSLFLIFLKIGAILYGSGYVLVAFLRADLVVRLGWLTDPQLIDAIAIGQVTPGPLFTSATFIGYLLAGVPGALLATAGIFLPSFVFVALSNPLIPRMRKSLWLGSLLDGVNVSSLSLMAAVTWQLGRATLIDPFSILITVVALGLLVRFKINSTWLIAGGALLGLVRTVV